MPISAARITWPLALLLATFVVRVSTGETLPFAQDVDDLLSLRVEESPAPTQVPTQVPTSEDCGCPDRCYRLKFRAVRDYRFQRYTQSHCEVQRCALASGRWGWKCGSTVNPSVPPHPAPPCPNHCYRARRRARRDCRYKSHPFSRCIVQRCHLRNQHKRRGWTCGSPATSSAPPTPSASPSNSGTDPSDSTFEGRTFRNGRLQAARKDSATDGSGAVFDVKYDLTLASGGVVSLDGIAESVEAVTCSQNGSIRIQLSPDAPVSELSKMYPVGAILIVSNDLFGECNITEPVVNEDESEEDREVREAVDQSANFTDTFLYIEGVSGTSRDATVRGVPVGYFALFDEADIEIVLQEPFAGGNSSSVVRKTATESFTDLSPTDRDLTLTIDADVFSLGPLEVTAKGIIQERGGFKSFKAKWGKGSVDIELRVINEWEFTLEVEADFKVGVSTGTEVKTLISQLLYGLPAIDFVDGLDLGEFKLPTFKLGFYFEVPLILELEANIEKQIGTQLSASYKTTRTELIMFMRGPYTDIDLGVDTVTLSPSSRKFDFTPTFDAASPIQVNIAAFIGVRPQFAVYIPVYSARVSVDVGVEVKGETLLGEGNAYPPVTDNSVLKFGECDTCHHLQVTGTGKVRNAGIFAQAALDLGVRLFGFNITVSYEKELATITYPGNPSASIDIAKGCFIEQYEGRAEICGDQCCDSDVGMCQTVGSPPTQQCEGEPSPSPDETPTPVPTPTPGTSSSCYTDPHLRTFDGFSYDCQALGEFILVKSEAIDFEIQARFDRPSTGGTVTKGLAVRAKDIPTVQISIASNASSPSVSEVGSCPVLLYVDGVVRNITAGTGQDSLISVSVSVGQNIQTTLSNGISVSFRVRTSSTFGCYFEFLNTFLPDTVARTGDIRGLLGSPNGDPYDDWMTPSGDVLDLPRTSTERLFEPAYTYCTTHWCIRDEAKSIFTYESGNSFADFSKCDAPYGSAPDFSTASEALQNLCGNDAACLVDGLSGDIDDARAALNTQAELDELSATRSAFRFEPATIAVGSTVNVKITLDMNGRPAAQLADLEKFSVVRVDSDSGEPDGSAILQLEDNGSAVASDDIAGDLVFSNVLAIRSDTAGERLSFRAIPIIAGELAPNSSLVVTALDAVRSYSLESNIGVGGAETTQANISSLSGLELIVRYSWPSDQSDLDTATAFNNELVGFSCDGAEENYVSFSGDDTSAGGTETIIVELDRARKDKVWTDSTTVAFRAGWFGLTQRGPATLRMALRNASTEEEVSNTALLIAIEPGVQNGCAEKVVGKLTVVVGSDVQLKLTRGAAASQR